MSEILHIQGKDEFLRMVQASDMPVLVKFGHHHCPPCVAVAPVLDKLAHDFGAELRVVEIDTRLAANSELKVFAPQGVPQFRLFLEADERDALLGFADYAALRHWLVTAMRELGRPVPENSEPEQAFAKTAADAWAAYRADARNQDAYNTYAAQLKSAVERYLACDTGRDTSTAAACAVCRLGDKSCRS